MDAINHPMKEESSIMLFSFYELNLVSAPKILKPQLDWNETLRIKAFQIPIAEVKCHEVLNYLVEYQTQRAQLVRFMSFAAIFYFKELE